MTRPSTDIENGHIVDVVRAPLPTKVHALDLDILSELAGCTTEELIGGLQHDRNHTVGIAGAVVTANERTGTNDTPVGVVLDCTIPVEDGLNSSFADGEFLMDITYGSFKNGNIPINSFTQASFIAKPPKTFDAAALVLATPPVMDENRNIEHGSHLPYAAATAEHAKVQVANEHISDQFHGFLLGVENVNSSSDLLELRDEAEPLLGEDQETLHPVAFSIPVGTSDETTTITRSDSYGAGAHLMCVSSDAEEDMPNPSEAAYLIHMEDALHPANGPKVYLAVPNPPVPEDHYFPSLDHRRESILDRTLDFTLPSDVEQVVVKTVGEDRQVKLVVGRSTPIIGYILLTMALCSMSSLGAAIDMIDGAPPLLKLYWRMSADSIIFFPMALISVLRDGSPTAKFCKADYGRFVVTSMCYCVFSGAFLISLDYTNIGAAFLFGNCHSLFLVVGKVVSGVVIACLEGTGAIVGLIGAVLCTLDEPASIPGIEMHPLKGDLFALASALGGCGYLLLAKKLRCKLDLFVFMVCLVMSGSFFVLILMRTTGVHFTLSRHRSHGLFGWTSFEHDRLPIQLYISLVCDLIGLTGYVAVMKYFDPLVVSVVMLLEPVVATMIGLIVNVGGVPGIWMVVGGSIVTLGTLMVTAASSNRTETYDIKKALHLLRRARKSRKDKKTKKTSYGAVAQ